MRKILLALTLSALLAAAPLGTARASSDTFPATVTDISDRAYRPAVMQLLDHAKRSIVISMYAVSIGSQCNNALQSMVDRLFAARKRGVSVTLYLNNCFRSSERSSGNLVENPLLDKLRAAGCTVILLPSNRKLHDKLIIVDSKYIIEGSTNWSLAALFHNFESATLTRSPDLAEVKLLRLANLPTEETAKSGERQKRVPSELYLEGLPAELTVPAAFVEDKRYLNLMLRHVDNRGISLYLLLLAHSQKKGQKDLSIDVESMGLSLGMPETWDNLSLRRQTLNALTKLDTMYGLAKVQLFHGRNAAVKLIDMPGKTFTVATRDLELADGEPLSARVKWFILVKAYLAANGEDIGSMSNRSLGKRFGVDRYMIGDARKDLEKKEK